ncbi:glycosyltransferase [Bacillus toyonensis]|uniref:glycosyltransferase n=1 Tax=Bacillus toyonensis TaxID=155322 RepID=UPI0018D1D660|nr:glycosyltransferase [Bacillus toyonensis]
MAKIYFFNVAAYGHVNPTINVALELKRRGHDITLFNYREFKFYIESLGLKFVAYEDCVNDLTEKNKQNNLFRIKKSLDLFIDNPKEKRDYTKLLVGAHNSPQVMHSLLIALDTLKYLDPTIELLNTEKPNCIFVDNMCPWPRLAAKITGTKMVSSVISLINDKDQAYIASKFPEHQKLYVFIDKVMNKMRENYKLNSSNYELYETAADIITYTSNHFYQGEFDSKKKVAFIGSTISEKSILSSKDQLIIDELNSFNGIKIYISLGTIVDNLFFYKEVIKQLSNKNIKVVMNIGNKSIEDLNLDTVPDNFMIGREFNQIEIIKNVDAVICHGGMSTTHESLYFQKPVWIMPLVNDNFFWADKVKSNDVGIITDISSFHSEDVYENIIGLVQNNRVHKNLEKISQSLKEAGGAIRAAEILEEKAREKVNVTNYIV